MKKFICLLLSLMMCFSLACCNNTSGNNSSSNQSAENNSSSEKVSSSEQQASSSSVEESSSISVPDPIAVNREPITPVTPVVKANPKIFLAGDSTVKTYPDKQAIGGWGQYLQQFLNAESVTVVNKAEGGRSSRSFINEGRLYKYDHVKTTSYTPIESEIENGDYLFIQFGHNDDDTGGGYTNYLDRRVPVGEPDKDGIYPTIVPQVKVSTLALPEDYANYYANAQSTLNSGLNTIKAYGDFYYSYDCGGTFKGYLKMYIDFARSVGAIPVLMTPVTRVSFDSTGTQIIGANSKHGKNLEYVESVRQLAKEEDCLLIDLYDVTKTMMEITKKEEADLLMALKPNGTALEWPAGYDANYTEFKTTNKTTANYITGIEGTHYNKYGAYLTAAILADKLGALAIAETTTSYGESITFGANILATASSYIVPSTLMREETVTALEALVLNIKLHE